MFIFSRSRSDNRVLRDRRFHHIVISVETVVVLTLCRGTIHQTALTVFRVCDAVVVNQESRVEQRDVKK